MRDWLRQAARIYVDMERGLYDWGGRKQPKGKDGNNRIVKAQILRDCGKDTNQRKATERIWENPEFLGLLEDERRRRDTAITSVVREIEAVAGPLIELRTKMQENVQSVFERAPDDEDPLALSPHQYVTDGLAWCRYIDELTGRTKSQSEQAIQSVVSELAQANKITAGIAREVLDLSNQYREQLGEQLAGVLDGELAD